MEKQNVISVIRELIEEHIQSIDRNVHLNERYLHHYFSHIIQKEYPITFDTNSKLHPEWATCIEGIRNDGGRYKYQINDKDKKEYTAPETGGSTGFIDFALGDYNNPDYGIEFKMSMQCNKEGLIFDYMKLLDRRNKIQKAISVAVYYGHASHSRFCEINELEKCLNEARKRLGNQIDNLRYHWFVVLEIIDNTIANRFESEGDGFKIINK